MSTYCVGKSTDGLQKSANALSTSSVGHRGAGLSPACRGTNQSRKSSRSLSPPPEPAGVVGRVGRRALAALTDQSEPEERRLLPDGACAGRLGSFQWDVRCVASSAGNPSIP